MNRGDASLRPLVGIVMSVALVVGSTAVLLRVVDSLPRLLRGEPRGVKYVASIEDAERVLHDRILVPAYFPDTLRWPPQQIAVHAGVPTAVALTFSDLAGERALILVESRPRGGAIPATLLRPAVVLHATTVTVGDSAATLVRLQGADGRIWNDLRWDVSGRTVVLRYRGGVEQLLRMAKSVRGHQ